MLVKLINDFDEYLTSSTLNGTDSQMQERRMVSRRYVEALQEEYEKTGKEFYLEKMHLIKTADKFGDEFPLQQHFAPIWVGGRLVYQKNNFKETLAKYFTLMTQKVAMTKIENFDHFRALRKKLGGVDASLTLSEVEELSVFEHMIATKAVILMIYYKLFGKNNPLGLKYDADNHIMQYIVLSRNSFALPRKVSFEQVKMFFGAIFGKKDPLHLTYDEKTHTIFFDSNKIEHKLNSYAIDVKELYKNLFMEKMVDNTTGKVKKIYHDPLGVYTSAGYVPFYNYDKALSENKKLNLQNIYKALFFTQKPNSDKTFDPFSAKFDEASDTITLHPGHTVRVNIPQMPFCTFVGKHKSSPQEDVSIEEFFMGTKTDPRKIRSIYRTRAVEHKNAEDPVDDNAKSARPSAIEKFNDRLAKTKEMQGK